MTTATYVVAILMDRGPGEVVAGCVSWAPDNLSALLVGTCMFCATLLLGGILWLVGPPARKV